MARVSAATRRKTRDRLLQSAAREFAEHGIDGANINRISLGAGLAKGTVYNYFKSKDDLFLEVVREVCAREVSAARLPAEGTARERLRMAIGLDVEWVKANEAFARVFIREILSAHPARYQAVLEAAAPTLALTSAILEQGQQRGEVRADLPAMQMALALSGLTEMAYVQHWGSGGAWPAMDDIPELVLAMFFDGVAPRPSPSTPEPST